MLRMYKSDSCTRICLWSGPRNVSTAMMYSFAQRKDTVVYDEPFYGYYLHESKAKTYHPGAEEIMKTLPVDYSKVVDLIMGKHEKRVVFFKNMTHHLLDDDISFTKCTKNIILVRNPVDMLPSFDKVISNPSLNDVGYKSSLELLNRFKQNKSHVVVLDSKNLLMNPQQILIELCESLEINFETSMLQWEKGPIEEDGVWAKYWYRNVHQSKGFKPYPKTKSNFPIHLNQLLDQCVPYYNELMKFSI
jgi:hypothetical protein